LTERRSRASLTQMVGAFGLYGPHNSSFPRSRLAEQNKKIDCFELWRRGALKGCHRPGLKIGNLRVELRASPNGQGLAVLIMLRALSGYDLSGPRNGSIRRWVLKFGPVIAKNLRESRPKAYTRWHLDEMVVSWRRRFLKFSFSPRATRHHPACRLALSQVHSELPGC